MNLPSAHDWTEDFSLENGQYQNKCLDCGELFLGHKRRVSCKLCSTPSEGITSETILHVIDITSVPVRDRLNIAGSGAQIISKKLKDLEMGKTYFGLQNPPFIFKVKYKNDSVIKIEHKFGTEQIQLRNENKKNPR